MTTHHLAQLNIGRIVAPLDSPQLAGFVARLDEINALAEASPGFIWRFQTEAGDATALRPYDDDHILVNFSVWESAESLHQYVYRTAHAELMRQRREWFERMEEAFMVLWWIPAGHRQTVEEAIGRLGHLRAHGPSVFAFTYRALFPAPDVAQPSAPSILRDQCPAR
jgi:heme-degrading monooxygenase HmoA